jgi:hypothetical protein
MKLFPKIIFYLLLAAGILMTFLPLSWFPSFYDVRYSGWSMIGTALIIYFVPLLIRVPSNSPDAEKKNKAANLLQLFLTLTILADALGALGLYELYDYGIPYSYILHVTMTFAGVIILTIVINQRFDVRIIKAAVIAFIIVLSWGVVWEIYENLNDHVFGTHLTGASQTSTKNTTDLNLIQDTIGASCGLILILLKTHFSRKKLTA